jgi:hypothetical protein
MEQSGATVAINDLLVSVHGHDENASMVLFPGGWPAGEAVSFERIRIKGAFTVSASAMGAGDKADGSAANLVKLTAPVGVTSLAGQNLTFAWPWPGAKPSVTAASGGATVALETAACGVRLPCYRFATTQGASYQVAAAGFVVQELAATRIKTDDDRLSVSADIDWARPLLHTRTAATVEVNMIPQVGDLSHVYGGVRRDETTDFTLTAVQPCHTKVTDISCSENGRTHGGAGWNHV